MKQAKVFKNTKKVATESNISLREAGNKFRKRFHLVKSPKFLVQVFPFHRTDRKSVFLFSLSLCERNFLQEYPKIMFLGDLRRLHHR